MWPRFHPQDRVRIRASGRLGYVNEIEPNEHGDDWLFEIAFDRGDVARYETGELELVEVLGLEHEA